MAREKALEARKLRTEGSDPIDVKRIEKAAKRLADAKAMTFKQCAEAYIASQRDGCPFDDTARPLAGFYDNDCSMIFS